MTRRQDLTAFLPVLYSAIERYGPPQTLVTDGGGIFRADRALAIYEALGIRKEEIERRQAWQSLIETTFGIQRRMADYHFAKAESFEEAVEIHGRWMSDYNSQRHWAHEGREDGRHSPEAVLGFYTATLRYHPEDLRRAFFSVRFSRVLDSLGYARLMHWRILGHEGLAKRDVALWLGGDVLSVEYAGEALSRYEVEYQPGSGSMAGKLIRVRHPELFETAHLLPQPRLFGLEILGEGWLKALRLQGYAARGSRPDGLRQMALFSSI